MRGLWSERVVLGEEEPLLALGAGSGVSLLARTKGIRQRKLPACMLMAVLASCISSKETAAQRGPKISALISGSDSKRHAQRSDVTSVQSVNLGKPGVLLQQFSN